MRLLRLLSWQYARRHVLRSLLTTAGIVLGVAVFVGMHTANQSVLKGFQGTVDRISGKTQLQVLAGDTGFSEDVLERVQTVAGVRVAVPVIEAVVDSGFEGQGNLLILGVDMLGDRSLRDYDIDTQDEAVDDPLVFLAQPDSLIVTRQFAEANKLHVGSKLSMNTMDGEKQFTVRGIMTSGGLASAFGGNLAVMDIYSAQKVFGRGRMFDRIDLAVNEGVPVEDIQRKLRALLGPGFEVEPPAARGRHFESVARAFAISIDFTSLFALMIGMFIIYNSFAIAVTQRRAEIGILRALGATRGQIRNLFLAEGAIAGLLGSAVGLFFGVLMARGMSSYVSNLLGKAYGIAQQTEELSTNPKVLLTAMLIGLATSLVAAWLPARKAAGVDPVKALQKGRYQVLSAGENRIRHVLAIVLAVLSAAAMLKGDASAFVFYASYMMLVIAALLLTPGLALWLAKAVRPAMRWLRPVEGALAADSLIQAPRRTSATVAALMLSLALAVGFGGISRSSYISIVDWVDTALNPDLFASSSQTFTSRSFRFPPSVGDGIRRIEGVREVQGVRTARVLYQGTPIMLIATDVESLMRNIRYKIIAGDPSTMWKAAASGKGVVISENLSILRKLKLGDIVEIAAPGGVMRLPVTGINVDYSDQQGSVLIDRMVYLKYWNDDSINVFRIYLNKGASGEEVKRKILAEFGSLRRLFVFTNSEIRSFIVDVTNQWFGLTYIQLGVAVLVAILGIVNTLTVSITDRRRELGVLQAVGAMRRQIRHTIWMEAVGVGMIGVILGLALGAVNLWYTLTMVNQHVAGYSLSYRYPLSLAVLLVPVILVAAFAAALGPAESAVRGSLVEALEYE